MALPSIDAALAGARPPVFFYKVSATSEGAGTFHSLWQVAGFPGAAGNPPLFSAGSGYTCSRTTPGALPFSNPVSGGTSHLITFGASTATIGALFLYDRLWTCNGFATNVTTLQSITTPGAIPARDASGSTNGDGVELWLEIYSAPGATAATWTVTYTNSAGVGGRTATYLHPANAETAGQMVPMVLQAGDTGVRSVESFQCSVSSGTAGNVGITLLRRLAFLPLSLVNAGQLLDALACGAPLLPDDACLALMVQCTTTNTGAWQGQLVYTQPPP
jgi:hypothetical protein